MTKNNKNFLKFTIITGKGNNSKGGIPILFGRLSNYFKD